MSEWNMYETWSEGKINKNIVYTCTPEQEVRTLLAGSRGGESDKAYDKGVLEPIPPPHRRNNGV